jgi:Stage II sporulation protein E (SpoIIE)
LRARLLVLISVISCAIAGQAQSGLQIFVPETTGWRAHLGDDPAYADPTFDDASWPVVAMARDGFPDVLTTGHSRWFRKHIVLPQDSGPIDLLITSLSGSYELYVDGRRVTSPIESTLLWRKSTSSIYPLRTASNPGLREVEIAIRSHLYLQPFNGAVRLSYAAIGSPSAVVAKKTALDGVLLGAYIFPLAVNIIIVIAGILMLTLYLQQRRHSEYLWLGVSLVCFGMDGAGPGLECFLAVSSNGLLCDPLGYWAMAAQLQFVYAFVGRKPHRAVRLYQIALVFCPLVINPISWSVALSQTLYVSWIWLENSILLPGIILLVTLLTVWTVHRNREAGILLGPMLMAQVSGLLFDTEIAFHSLSPAYQGIPSLHLGLVQITYWPFSEAVFMLAVGVVIFLRFVHVSREQVRAQSELEAARIVQSILIPEEIPAVPGFELQSVYKPAGEVGGDFFQIIPIANGGVLITVGDVSGKGMPAAMTVSLLVGTLRTLAHYTQSPSEILAAMNQRMMARSSGGFTTCLVLTVSHAGNLTAANAGHIAPYVNGRELAIANGLPLGLSAHEQYPESTFTLTAGEQLTLMTDGVVEARATNGELLGFERMKALVTHSAESIVRAAQNYGQDDDITVLTLRLAPN